MSDVTKKYKAKYRLFSLMSMLLTVGPLIVYFFLGFSVSEPVKRVILSMTAISAILLTLINLTFKIHLRSAIYLLMLGIHVCISNITGLIIVMAATTLLDEIVATPLAKHYKQKYTINKEIDARL